MIILRPIDLEPVGKSYQDWSSKERQAYWLGGTAAVAGSRAPKGKKRKAVTEHLGTRVKGALGPAAAGAGIGAGLGAGAALASRGRIRLGQGVGYGSYGAGVLGATIGGQRAGLQALEHEDRRRRVSKVLVPLDDVDEVAKALGLLSRFKKPALKPLSSTAGMPPPRRARANPGPPPARGPRPAIGPGARVIYDTPKARPQAQLNSDKRYRMEARTMRGEKNW